MDNILEVKGLTVDIGEKRVIDDVSFTLYPGVVTALVGESGCGKTMTALSVLNLLPESARVSKGNILFKGSDITVMSPGMSRRIRGRDIGMVFQEPFMALNPVMRISEQIEEVYITHRVCKRPEIRSKIRDLLSTVKLPPDTVYYYPHELSGGMRQRIMLAMCLACDPELLILDEPTTALDVSIQKHILDLVRRIQGERGLSMLFITHDFSVVNMIADKVCVMRNGEIVESGDKNKILREPSHEYTRQLIACIPRLGDARDRLPVVSQ